MVGIAGYALFGSGEESGSSQTQESVTDGKDVQETPKEEVKLLAAQSQELRDQISDLKTEIGSLKDRPKENGGESDVNNEQVFKYIDEKLDNALNKLTQIDPGNAPNADGEVTFDVQPENPSKESADMSASNSGSGFETRFEVGSEKSAYQSGPTRWEMPVGYSKESGSVIGNVKDEVATWGDKVKSTARPSSGKGAGEQQMKPYVTIPSDSRIYDVQAVTALVGRIEKNGQNKAPWEFSATLSGNASLANGFSLPEIEEARVSGVAIGDMAGECVKGFVTSITFIFPDGRIANAKGSVSEPLARVADKYGNPCVPGVYFDNMNEVIAAQGTLAGLSSFASSIQKRQQSLESSATSQSLVLDGSESLAALGAVGSGGLNKASDILAEKYDAYYSFVYVEPGENITLLVDNNIAIDYDETGRKVRYDETTDFVFN
ncbi:MAG: hypothetical protein CME37_19575 [Haliea sp.]|nr:hypothetical protein [Haliea sp.]